MRSGSGALLGVPAETVYASLSCARLRWPAVRIRDVAQADKKSSAVWEAYNALLLGPDVDRIRKLVVRYELAKRALEVPGDFAACGVFKGAGCLYWLKLLHILEPESLRRVFGFDMFTELGPTGDAERSAVENFVLSSGFDGVDPVEITAFAEAAGLGERHDLVAGDIAETAPKYLDDRPGARFALLHLDLDTYQGTRGALDALYPRVTRGGLVVIDEYAVAEWHESNAVDDFLENRPEIRLARVPHSAKPAAYFVKP
jgi:hypothetical protein